MHSYSPFEVKLEDEASITDGELRYQIWADFEQPHLAAYKALFEQFGLHQGVLSLVDVTHSIIIDSQIPGLSDQMEFDEEGYLLDMYVDGEPALKQFAEVVCPVFQELAQLELYVRQAAAARPGMVQLFLGNLRWHLRRLLPG